jgi:hypothetical protein
VKLPLKIGLPLLGLLLLGLALSEGPAKLGLLLAAMGVALWSAFSLPRPTPRPDLRVIVPDEDDPAPGNGDDPPPGEREGPR